MRPATACLHVLMCRAEASQLKNEVAKLCRLVNARESRITWLLERGERLGVNLLMTEPDDHEHAGQVAQVVQFAAQPPKVSIATCPSDTIRTICCQFSKLQMPPKALPQRV